MIIDAISKLGNPRGSFSESIQSNSHVSNGSGSLETDGSNESTKKYWWKSRYRSRGGKSWSWYDYGPR
ncbi:hypothetical protein CYY_006669 [Polysphondylium violaceum]|uniref:Uncharacterized protein n=1 Tax=Polysphondylium violaceum TaxID=133409 RepID=A0A8J4PRW1_9MYCE|nr:hypothetical protein CYY_006669 [Polysphondylium violaceum]